MQRNRHNEYDRPIDPDQGASPWTGPAEFPYRGQPPLSNETERYGQQNPAGYGRGQASWGSPGAHPIERGGHFEPGQHSRPTYEVPRDNWGPGQHGDQDWRSERPQRDTYQGGYGPEHGWSGSGQRGGFGSRSGGREADYGPNYPYRAEDPREGSGYGGGDQGARYGHPASRGSGSGGYGGGYGGSAGNQGYGSGRTGNYGLGGSGGGYSGGGGYGGSQGYGQSGQDYRQGLGQGRSYMQGDTAPVDAYDTQGGTWRSHGTGERRSPKGYTRSDERIREDVNDRLMHDYNVDPGDIEVTVEKGEVTLKGDVRSRDEKFRAEQIAESVSGVTDVTNNLRVKKRSGSGSSSSSRGADDEHRSDSQAESKWSGGSSGASSTTSGIGSTSGSGKSTTGSQSRSS